MDEKTVVFVRQIQHFVSNTGNREMQEAAKAIVNIHLTNQQRLGQFVSFLIDAIHEYKFEDLRNEDTKAWVAQIKASVPPGYFPLI